MSLRKAKGDIRLGRLASRLREGALKVTRLPSKGARPFESRINNRQISETSVLASAGFSSVESVSLFSRNSERLTQICRS